MAFGKIGTYAANRDTGPTRTEGPQGPKGETGAQGPAGAMYVDKTTFDVYVWSAD